MFKRTDKPAVIDTVVAVEAHVKYVPQIDKEPNCTFQMMYVKTPGERAPAQLWTTFGTCPMAAPLMSPKTRLAMKAFLESAEEDFGRLLFGGSGMQAGEDDDRAGDADSGKPLTGLGDT